MSDLVIGIDPDAQKSGIALYRDGALAELHLWSFSQLVAHMMVNAGASDITYVLEDVEAIRPTFKRVKTNQAAMQKISQNVGQVKQTARLIQEMGAYYGAEVVMVKPLKGVAKSAKDNTDIFKQITGWAGRSNADNRDAAMLALHYIRGRRTRAHG